MNETLNNNNLPEIPSGEELIQQKNEVLFAQDEWTEMDISGNFLDVTEAYCPPRYTLSWDGVKFAPVGGVHVITGQSGNGKTFTFTQMIVAILRGNYYNLRYELVEEIPQPIVLYIDTEQERENTKLVNLRIYEMMGWKFHEPHDEFRILCLREEETAMNRWRKVLKAIETIKPTVCFLDGMLDVVKDFNDNAECSEMVYKNMKLASHYGMSLWVLVHENPGTTKMVGHLGSILQRKVTDELSSVKEKNDDTGEVKFIIKQKKNRGKDMKAWKFRIIDGPHSFGIPQMIDNNDIPTEDSLRLATLNDLFEKINIPKEGIRYKDIERYFQSKGYTNKNKIQKMINEALGAEIIIRPDGKIFFFKGLDENRIEKEVDFMSQYPHEDETPF